MAVENAIKWVVVMILLIFMALSINCVSGNQQPINNSTAEPTGITVVAEKDKILVDGEGDWIIAQLYYKGEPQRKKGVNVTFSSDNDATAILTKIKRNATDENGKVMIFLTSNMTPGRVKVTVSYGGSNGVITNSTYVDVVRWGNIAGIIRDKNGIGIGNAMVSVYDCIYNETTKKWENTRLAKIQENPQLTNDGRTGPSGQYTFYRVPEGTYNLTVERNGHIGSSILSLEQGTVTSMISLSDYEFEPLSHSSNLEVNIPAPAFDGGTIWGIVVDQNKVSLLNANVTLWYGVYNKTISRWEKGDMVSNSGNPQFSNDGKTKARGEFQFDNVQQGVYYIMAHQEGHTGYAIVQLNSNLVVRFIVIPDFYYMSPF